MAMLMEWGIPYSALERLRRVEVTIAPVYAVGSGSSWNTNEAAWVRVDIKNSSWVPLRDVVLRTIVTGAARVRPITLNAGEYDEYAYWAELEPWESKYYWVPLKAQPDPGTANIWVSVWAEVIPYAYRYNAAVRWTEVYPQ